eukprot:scaffold52576_cov19-Tisochrysis_lutea.AAC.1
MKTLALKFASMGPPTVAIVVDEKVATYIFWHNAGQYKGGMQPSFLADWALVIHSFTASKSQLNSASAWVLFMLQTNGAAIQGPVLGPRSCYKPRGCKPKALCLGLARAANQRGCIQGPVLGLCSCCKPKGLQTKGIVLGPARAANQRGTCAPLLLKEAALYGREHSMNTREAGLHRTARSFHFVRGPRAVEMRLLPGHLPLC